MRSLAGSKKMLSKPDVCGRVGSSAASSAAFVAPQAFLKAAERLDVKPTNCLVIEDAVAGVAAAERSGMAAIAVTNTHPAESLKQADFIVDSLEKVGTAIIDKLINKNRRG